MFDVFRSSSVEVEPRQRTGLFSAAECLVLLGEEVRSVDRRLRSTCLCLFEDTVVRRRAMFSILVPSVNSTTKV